MEYGIVAAGVWVGVEEELSAIWPECTRELQEDFGVGAHVECFDCCAFPGWEGGGECDGVVLEDAEGEGADCVGGGYACAVAVIHCDAGV